MHWIQSERMERILDGVGRTTNDVRFFGRDDAYEVCREISSLGDEVLLPNTPRQHQCVPLFTRIVIDQADKDSLLTDRPEDVNESLLRPLLGYITLVKEAHPPESDRERNVVCWNTQDFGVMTGCPHGCMYCSVGRDSKVMVLGLNIREYVERVVARVVEEHPAQRCFRMIGWAADIITFEPEYGVFDTFLQKLSEYPGRYGYFHTASDNVDWVRDVPHCDRLIGVWSMASGEVARVIEPGSPSEVARIEAVRKCQEWGVPTRVKFKPIVPIRRWRDDYARTIEEVFKRTAPESIGFCVLMWMNFDQLEKMIDIELLDPYFVSEAWKHRGELEGVRVGPFPHHIRAEVYRFFIREVRKWDRRIPLYISTESREMWDELQGELGQNPKNFICGCNPVEPPGPRLVLSEPTTASTCIPPADIERQ